MIQRWQDSLCGFLCYNKKQNKQTEWESIGYKSNDHVIISVNILTWDENILRELQMEK